MKIINLKDSNGFGLSDTIVAIVIMMLFTALIVSISYNIYLQSTFVKRNDSATNYIVELFEYANTLPIQNVTTNSLTSYVNNKDEKIEAIAYNEGNDPQPEQGYLMIINVTDVKTGTGGTVYIKQIDVTVKYRLSKNVKNVTMSTLINK